VEGYRSCSFDCRAGSQFHRGDVSLSPPIMPDGRISRVRFEALAFRGWAFPAASRLKRWCAYTPSTTGLLIPSSLSLATVWCARFYQAEPVPVVGTTKCPESLCRMLALPSSESRVTDSSEDITPRSSLLRTHSPILGGSPFLRFFASLKESLPVATSPGCAPGSSRRYFCESVLCCLSPYPGESHGVHLPGSSSMSSAFPKRRIGRLLACFREHDFPRACYRGCSYFVMFRPHSLLASQIVPTAAS